MGGMMSSTFFKNMTVPNRNPEPIYVVGTERSCRHCDGHERNRLIRRKIKGRWVELRLQQTHCCRWTASCVQHDSFELPEDLYPFKYGFGQTPEDAIAVYINFVEGRALVSHFYGKWREEHRANRPEFTGYPTGGKDETSSTV